MFLLSDQRLKILRNSKLNLKKSLRIDVEGKKSIPYNWRLVPTTRSYEIQYQFGSLLVMKFLFLSVVLCYVSAASIEDSKNLIRNELKIFKKCMVDGNVTESAVEGIFKKGEIPETRAIKCLLGCHMKGMGYLSDDGKIDWNKLDEINKVQYVDPVQAKKALEVGATCSKKVSQNLGNICDAGYATSKCFIEEAIKVKLPILGPESAQ